jgi:nucleoside-diphosphate-sugar epimerase
MKILLTGATGFIGKHLVDSLQNEKHDVAQLLRKASVNKGPTSSNVYVYESLTQIDAVLSKFRPDVVMHLAALYINKHCMADIEALVNSNITYGTCLLEAMKNNGMKKFINFGTRWQHLDDECYKPANLYAASKEAFQDMLIYYGNIGIKYKTIELCDTYGACDTRKKIIDLMFEACINREQLDLSPGEQLIDVVSVDDICNFLIKELQTDFFYDNSRIGLSGNTISLRELGRLIEKITNVSGYLNFGSKPYRENEVMIPPKSEKMISITEGSLEINLEKYFYQKLNLK